MARSHPMWTSAEQAQKKIDELASKLEHARADSEFYASLALKYLDEVRRSIEVIMDHIEGRGE